MLEQNTMAALFSCSWSLFTFRLVQSGHSASEITNATFQASITRNERFETIDQLRLLCRALAEQATQKRLALKKKQRKPPPPTPTPPKSRKSHQCIAIEFPNFPGLVLTPLKRQKRAGLIKHPGLGPEMHGNGSMMMVPPKRVLSPPPSTYNRKTLVSSWSTFYLTALYIEATRIPGAPNWSQDMEDNTLVADCEAWSSADVEPDPSITPPILTLWCLNFVLQCNYSK